MSNKTQETIKNEKTTQPKEPCCCTSIAKAEEPCDCTPQAKAEEPYCCTSIAKAEEPCDCTPQAKAEEPCCCTSTAKAEEPCDCTPQAKAEEPCCCTSTAKAEEPCDCTPQAKAEEPCCCADTDKGANSLKNDEMHSRAIGQAETPRGSEAKSRGLGERTDAKVSPDVVASNEFSRKTLPSDKGAGDCCCHDKKAPVGETKQTPSSSCCGTSEPKKEPKQSYSSCCGTVAPRKEARQTYSSCCGTIETKKEDKQSYCSCCVDASEPTGNTFFAKHRKLIFLLISFASLVASFVMAEIPALAHTIWHYLDLGFIAVVLCGLPIMRRAVLNLVRGRKFNERITSPLLITIAMLACIALQIIMWTGALTSDGHSHSYIFAAGEIAWLMAVGSLIEEFTIKKARSGIERLVNLAPVTAKVRENGVLVEKPLSEISIGDIVTVLPNDMISVDGEVISGTTSVDQAIMTGESVPVDKQAGDFVFGGTWNKSGAIEVRVVKAEDDMTINKLRKIVEEAEGKKAPISKLADRFASYVIPTAIILSIFIFVVNFFAMSSGLIHSIVNGVTMLVVFCPCALALATPTAVAAGLGNATKRGILIKSGGALEALAKVDTVAFDKTGTLTYGKIRVEKTIAYEISQKDLLFFAGSAEMNSEHPIAKAISDYAKEHVELVVPQSTKSLIGIGVEAEIDGKLVTVRKWDNLDSSIDTKFAQDDANALLLQGKTLVAIIRDGKLCGLIALADTIREGSKDCISELTRMGVKSAMLTGDNHAVAQNISDKIGISTVYASLMPEDKLNVVGKLKESGEGLVCMIGDGVNDAPALAAADCSLAIGTLGSDIAIETADAALMSGDIKKIPGLIRLARSMMTKIKINITISMSINFAAFLLSLFGVLDPVTGALVHNISSVLVVINSAFLLRKK